MKKFLPLSVPALALVVYAAGAHAVPPGKTLRFDKSPLGVVTFDGKKHADAGNKCSACHPKLFKMKKGSAAIKAPHKAGEFCGTCHDGQKAFAVTADCTRCHKKK